MTLKKANNPNNLNNNPDKNKVNLQGPGRRRADSRCAFSLVRFAERTVKRLFIVVSAIMNFLFGTERDVGPYFTFLKLT